MDVIKKIVGEPGAQSPEGYARRVLGLAILYPTLALGALTGELLLLWRAKLLVALTQRSNVETLTLAFFAVFFAYVGFLGAKGAPGGVRILVGRALARARGAEAVERRKQARLRPARGPGPFAALNVALELAEAPGRPFSLQVGDTAGPVGRLVVDGARIQNQPERHEGSSNLLAYFANQVQGVAGEAQGRDVDVVAWGTLDDEEARAYLAMVEFARNVGEALGRPALFPRVVLDASARAELERRLQAVCPALRDEALLPDWEYQAEHKLPIVPEPLGLASLGRTERRADPLPTLSALTAVVVVAVALLTAIVLHPPWVPGR